MVVTKGDVICPPVVKTRLPKIAKSNRATGVWSRKISPAGLSYLKMDDEVREREGEREREREREKTHFAALKLKTLHTLSSLNYNVPLSCHDCKNMKTINLYYNSL